jgi:hypothetical protein
MLLGARGDAIGLVTALQPGMSRDRFQHSSPGFDSAFNRRECQGYFLLVKGRQPYRLEN